MTAAKVCEDKSQCDPSIKSQSYDNSVATSSHITSPPQTPTEYTTYPLLRQDYQVLLGLCCEHAVYFKDDNTDRGQRLYAAFIAWQDFIKIADQLVYKIESFAYRYDFDSNTPGNGYRSFVSITDSAVTYGLNICRNLLSARNKMFFRKKHYVKEVEACSQLLSSICACLRYLLIMHEWSCESGDLFANGKHTAEDLLNMGETINQYSFYGRCLGFQYSESVRGILRVISIGMASFSETYYANDADGPIAKTTRSVWTSGKYMLNPESRARRIVNLSQNAKIDFCKSFWFLAENELFHKLPSIVGSSIRVNRIIEIPTEPLQLPRVRKLNKGDIQTTAADMNQNDNAEFVDIPVPSAHLGTGKPVQARLLDFRRREGMMGEGRFYNGWRKMAPRSSGILFHCHGGGFVAQSSKSHELYLRDWTTDFDAPILSIDYSLAPEAPFPRALEEAFYAYCWMLKNAEHLGTTAESVVLAGDSAGANICIGVIFKCIENGIRIPDGLFLVYCPILINFVPSPARLLCLMDPLLPFGFMMRCLKAYAVPDVEMLEENAKHVKEAAEIRNAAADESYLMINIEKPASVASSRRTSAAKSPLSSVAENSKWEQMKHNGSKISNGTEIAIEAGDDKESSSDTFASASDHSETVEQTDLPSVEDDNSSCVSFEDDSQPIVHYPIEISADPQTNSDSEKYIDRFLDQYLIDTATSEAKESVQNGVQYKNVIKPTLSKTASEENILIETGKDMIAFETLQEHYNNAVNSISDTLDHYTKSCEINSSSTSGQQHLIEDLRNMDALIARRPSEHFAFEVPKDPFLSPYFASDEWLAQLPQTKILTIDMDPCLDDCVMFAKKLKSLGRSVTLDILNGLPHGFLNFTMVSSEAMSGSNRCSSLIKELLKVPKVPNDNDENYKDAAKK